MLVAISISKTSLDQVPDVGRELTRLSTRVVEHESYCEYFVKEWKTAFELLNQHGVNFVFQPL